jgi:hypothetical protein
MQISDFEHIFNEEQMPVALALHHFLSDLPGIELKERYKIPFYYRRSWVCYLNPIKKGGVEIVFIYGNKLSNGAGLLSGEGRKQVMGVIYRNLAAIEEESLRETIHEALLLDEEMHQSRIR